MQLSPSEALFLYQKKKVLNGSQTVGHYHSQAAIGDVSVLELSVSTMDLFG